MKITYSNALTLAFYLVVGVLFDYPKSRGVVTQKAVLYTRLLACFFVPKHKGNTC